MHLPRTAAGGSNGAKKVLRDILQAEAANKTYDVHGGPKKRGTHALIEDETPQGEVVYRALESGLSTTQTTIVLNEWRAGRGLPTVSWSAVEGFVLRSEVIQRSRRCTKKSGKDDKGSLWAGAREAEFIQYHEQLRLGRLPADCKEVLDSIAAGLWPLHEDGIAWWDEDHKGVILDFTSKYENQIARNPYDKTPCSVKFWGVLPGKKPQTAVKFPGEARGCFGCAMVQRADGTMEGVKAEPYNYTGMWVVGVAEWEKLKEAEVGRVLKLGAKDGSVWKRPGYGYRGRYGDDWEEEVEKVLSKGKHHKVCITKLMDHVIAESTRMYAGSKHADDFVIFHDALKQWWEVGAKKHMKEKGFEHRQLRCVGDTNKGTIYEGKLPGDQPEICRALDAHGFADHKCSMAYHTILTSTYAKKDPRRFGMGTPEAVWKTMKRCWQMKPTSARIVEDISDFDRVLQNIIAAKGCVVLDEFLRTGRRSRRADPKAQERLGDCINKPRGKQRKAILVARPCHPDAEEARRKIQNIDAPIDHDLATEALGLLMDADMDDEEDVDVERELRQADMEEGKEVEE
jgi:hypothetical protein